MALGERFEHVLGCARNGEPWALEALYQDLSPAVAGYLRLQGAEDPEGVTSETFLSVMKSLSRFSGDEHAFRSWVFSIGHRRLIDERRSRARRIQTVPIEEAGEAAPPDAGRGPSVEDQVLGSMGSERLIGLCNRLSADQRDVVLLRLMADMSVAEVAHALGKRQGAVKAAQKRGLEALRRLLSEDSEEKVWGRA